MKWQLAGRLLELLLHERAHFMHLLDANTYWDNTCRPPMGRGACPFNSKSLVHKCWEVPNLETWIEISTLGLATHILLPNQVPIQFGCDTNLYFGHSEEKHRKSLEVPIWNPNWVLNGSCAAEYILYYCDCNTYNIHAWNMHRTSITLTIRVIFRKY